MRKGVLLLLVFVSFLSARANNVQLQGTVKVVSVVGGVATLEVDLSWENSWRDDYNWDATWLFFKYKSGVNGAWQHAAINTADAKVMGGDYTTMSGTTGATAQGLFVYPDKDRGGNTGSLKVQVQWKTSYTQAQFDNNDVFVVAHGIEMVYVPYGAYTIGDGSSTDSFDKISKELYGLIPESLDVVNDTSGYVITASAQHGASVATNAADHLNNSVYPTGSWYVPYQSAAAWWKIDFKTSKTIRYFGISGAANYPSYGPTVVWYFEGSNDDVNWTRLSVLDPGIWRRNAISYPVQQSLRVDKPGAYRHYRVNFPLSTYPIVQNIAMTDSELCAGCGSVGNFVDDESSKAYPVGGDMIMLPNTFPKGYQGFYVMKYETSQEEYVEFLNTLTLVQQTALIPEVEALNVGDFVFGSNKTAPNCRNSIILSGKITDKPLFFDNNLNNNKVYSEDADGGTLAMNYMSITDACGYASWAGLRPMTEMEYEKACRRPYPQRPDAGEFAWNSAAGAVNASGLTMPGSGQETVATGNVNAGGTMDGPVRCGIFARPTTANQAAAGATYWGVMEMSGNVSELCANITNTTISKTVNGTGSYNTSLYGAGPTGYGTRGGGFSDTHTTLATSSRDAVSRFTDALQRDSTVGFRCAFTYNDASAVDAGTFDANLATICPGDNVTFSGTPASVVGVKITGYVWSVKIGTGAFTIISGAGGATLTYSDFVANTTYVFKRKAICPLGESEVSKSWTIPNTAVFSINPAVAALDVCENGTLITASGGSSYRWTTPNGTRTGTTYTPVRSDFTTSGAFSVLCSGSVSGCAVTKTLSVTVDPLIHQTFRSCGDTVLDCQGNSYSTKQMADGRCWMTQNMRRTDVAYAYPNNSASNAIVHGCHYDWNTAMQGSTREKSQGICPVGWYIPTDDEWKVLEMAYGMTKAQADSTDFRGTNQGTQFKPGGSSGFNMTISGRNGSINVMVRGYYWSSSEVDEKYAWRRDVRPESSTVARYTGNKTSEPFPLRCVLD